MDGELAIAHAITSHPGQPVKTGPSGQVPQGTGRGLNPRLILALVLAGLAILAWQLLPRLSAGNDAGASRKERNHTVPVSVTRATTQLVPLEIHSIGNVLPYSVVNVLPQVSGQLKKVYFTQGQNVTKGQLLFEIDPRQYGAAVDQSAGIVARDQAQIEQAQATLIKDQAQVGQLQANVSRDQATANYAKIEADRYKNLLAQGAVSNEQSDQMATNLATARATVQSDLMAVQNARAALNADRAGIATARGTLKADQGSAESANLQLGWTQIRSPISGRTGSLNVYEGNIVTANSGTPLVTIQQVLPIYINFTVPEEHLTELRQNLANHTLTVTAEIEGSKADAVQGTVSFLENTVNTSTGTVTLRAQFANTDNRLFPGQFVDVVVSMPAGGPTVVVPTAAVQNTQQGSAVYVVGQDKTVQLAPVTVLRTQGDNAAIGSGLQEGDLVVTDGQLQLMPGAKVQVVSGKAGGGRHRQRSVVPDGDE